MSNTGFDERTIAQATVVVKRMVQAKAIPVPLVLELAMGSDEGWKAAALEYLVARKEGRRYTPSTVEQPNWEEEAGNVKGK